jgi:hypothetical protein
MRVVTMFLFAVAGLVALLTSGFETPSTKPWWGGLIAATAIALVALTISILTGEVTWRGVSPWAAIFIFAGPAAGMVWIWVQIDTPPKRPRDILGIPPETST